MIKYKNFLIVPDGTFGMMEIKPEGQGTVPKSLRGTFTSFQFAKLAIDTEMSKRENVDATPKRGRRV